MYLWDAIRILCLENGSALYFTQPTITKLYQEYIHSGQTLVTYQNCGHPQVIQEQDHKTMIVTSQHRVTLHKIKFQFSTYATQLISQCTV